MNSYRISKHPAKAFKYLDYVACIAANPGCTRRQIMYKMNGCSMRSRGQLSDMWSALLGAKFIRYDHDFQYFATELGKKNVARLYLEK